MLFSFGLFATHIPYLVLAALYVCYMGSWLISSLFPQLPVDSDAAPRQAVAVEQSYPVYAVHEKISENDSYYFSVKDFSDLTTAITIHPFERRIAFICLSVLPGIIKVFAWQLYNRPPPSFYITA